MKPQRYSYTDAQSIKRELNWWMDFRQQDRTTALQHYVIIKEPHFPQLRIKAQ